jgi:hypothetical protein
MNQAFARVPYFLLFFPRDPFETAKYRYTGFVL